ncbi:hypothetical protein KP509_1Z046200 [Ceratopteris richardii]|nr:hypothetical protein KP509_1Z046200 [Ceratopteris richardii]
MEFDEVLNGMHDVRLKVRLLSLVMANHLPDDRQPPKSPSELSIAVSVIRRHHLLSEDSGVIFDAQKAAVDAWVDRMNLLLSSTMTEKCWAGVCLIGVTCQECAPQRFLDLYTSWFQKLVIHLKPTDPLFVRGAAFASITDLLVRLGSLGNKREGTSLSAKLVQPVLQLLSEESSKSIWNDGIDMLCTVLNYFPAALKQQSPQVETLLVGKLTEIDMSSTVSQVVQKFARCLAMVPKAHGDAATWNSLIRRLLLSVNFYLDDAFKGMEDGTLAKKISSSLMPRGQEQTWFLGGMPITTNSMAEGSKRFWQLLVPRVSLLLQCCRYLLTNSFPAQVPVPLTAMLALITRILNVDGSPYGSASVLGIPTSTVHQVSLCCELPALHSCALDLLYSAVCGIRSQLLPRAAEIVRVITEYFRHCSLPNLRIKLYHICKHLLISMGVGMASELATALLDNLLADLKMVSSGSATYPITSPNAMSWGQGVPPWSHSVISRKRKEPGSMQMEMHAPLETSADMSDSVRFLAVQVAALEATEALLIVGGSLRSDHWRAEVDSIVANVAMIASTGSFSPSLVLEDMSCREEFLSFSPGSFQLAAYKALLASLLSPCMHRPPYLSQALTIFRKGRQEAVGSDISEFCARALLSLEPLIHPRSLPYASAQAMPHNFSTGRTHENLVLQVQRSVAPLPSSTGSLPSNANTNSQRCPTHMIAPVKVNESGMQIDVEGDPYVYVQEDIESWIVDYGDDQGVLNDDNPSLMVGGFDGEFQPMGNDAHVDLGNVSARQSLADDGDRVMMPVFGDQLPESRDVPRVIPDDNTADNSESGMMQSNGSQCNAAYVLESRPINMPEHHITDVSNSNPPFCIPTIGKEVDRNIDTAKTSDMFSVAQAVTEVQEPPPVSISENLSFPSAVRQNYSESDSDAIPDIVDGDPDTD